MLTATHKRLLIFKSHGDLNRCTPCRETWPIRHTHPTLSLYMIPDHTYLTRSTYINLSRSRQRNWAETLLPRKNGSRHKPQHTDWPIRGFVPSFSLETAIEVVGAKPIICWRPATRLIGPISPACDRYLQYLLVGCNPSVLNRHRRDLQPPKGPVWS
jgi:hypothetical protein